MDKTKQKKISKFMSLVLRHRPGSIGVQLDSAGWVSIREFLDQSNARGKPLTRETVEIVVAKDDKQRFEISGDGTQIRARQGHSVEVDLGYAVADPPELLLHGTPSQSVPAIKQQGLTKRKRHAVHLHADLEVARSVGQRRGTAVILKVEAKRMADAGHEFYLTGNHVWLTDRVPPEFIQFPTE